MNSFLLHRRSKVWTKSIDSHKINWRIEARFEKVRDIDEVFEGLRFWYEVDQYIDVTGVAGFITRDRSEQSNISHSVLPELREEVVLPILDIWSLSDAEIDSETAISSYTPYSLRQTAVNLR